MNSPTTEHVVEELTFREALLPPQLRELRQKLSQKAKQQKRFRFYSLYAHICRTDTLQAAWNAVRRNQGAPGVDGVSIEQIAASPESEAAFVAELQRSLKERTYRTQAVRRVYILKPNGKLRPLGIPTVRDRVVQAAVLLILEDRCFRQDLLGIFEHHALRQTAHFAIAIKMILVAVREKRGDRKLELARELAVENASVISQDDRDVIKERITL